VGTASEKTNDQTNVVSAPLPCFRRPVPLAAPTCYDFPSHRSQSSMICPAKSGGDETIFSERCAIRNRPPIARTAAVGDQDDFNAHARRWRANISTSANVEVQEGACPDRSPCPMNREIRETVSICWTVHCPDNPPSLCERCRRSVRFSMALLRCSSLRHAGCWVDA